MNKLYQHIPPDVFSVNWVPFISPIEGKHYTCRKCYDYGGILALDTYDHEYLPFMQSCPYCEDVGEIDDNF